MGAAADSIIRLLADPGRLKAFAAIALGATSTAAIATASGLSAREVASALRRLREHDLVIEVDAQLRVNHELFRDEARQSAPAEPSDPLAAFIRDGRLRRLPAQWERKVEVLRHVAEHTFTPGTTYDEKAVNGLLREWCADGEVDHVAVRRYLVDLRFLIRDDATATYRMPWGY